MASLEVAVPNYSGTMFPQKYNKNFRGFSQVNLTNLPQL